MSKARQGALAACMAACALAFYAASASAEAAIRMEPGGVGRGALTAASEGTVTFRSSLTNIICNMTFTGETVAAFIATSAARTLPEGDIIEFTEGRTASCTESGRGAARATLLMGSGEATAMALRYDAFLGTLPRITGLLFTGLRFGVQFEARETRCLYQGEIGMLVTFPPSEEAGRTRFNRVRILEANSLSLREGGIFCPREGSISGSFRLTPAQTLVLREGNRPFLVAIPLMVRWNGGNEARTVRFRNVAAEGTLTGLGWELGGIEAGYELRELTCTGAIAVGGTCELKVRPLAGAARGELFLIEGAIFVGGVVLRP